MLKLTGRRSSETLMATLRSLATSTPTGLMNSFVKSKLFTLTSMCLKYYLIMSPRLRPRLSTKKAWTSSSRRTLRPSFEMMEKGLLRMSKLSPLKKRAVLLRRKSQGRLWIEHLQWTSLSLCKFLFIEIMLKNNGCITLALPLTFLCF